jgi:hypothetical protein
LFGHAIAAVRVGLFQQIQGSCVFELVPSMLQVLEVACVKVVSFAAVECLRQQDHRAHLSELGRGCSDKVVLVPIACVWQRSSVI